MSLQSCTVTRPVQNCIKTITSLEGSGLSWALAECTFRNTHEVNIYSRQIVRCSTHSVLWQKERLLNLLLSVIPPEYTKVAWIDADLMFANPRWAVDASLKLDQCPVVQVFTGAIRLPMDHTEFAGKGLVGEGFGSVHRRNPIPRKTGYDSHGLTGFAWAARRDFLTRRRLYDTCIAGGADHFMAHAFTGDLDSKCTEVLFGGKRSRHREHAIAWAEEVYADVRGEVDCVPGFVLHLWHGAPLNRRYTTRYTILAENSFDPEIDIIVSPEGCWEWASDKPRLHQQLTNYFLERCEDSTE